MHADTDNLPLGWTILGLAVAVAMGLAAPAAAESSEDEESTPDPVRLAKMLVQDGHYDRAQKELAKVDPASAEDLDRASYHTVSGIVALRSKAYDTAVAQFDRAIRHGQVDDSIWVHLAQAHYGLNNWQKVVQMVRNADEAGREVPDLWLMRAEALRKLDRGDEAWATLRRARERFPDHRTILRQQVFLAVELGLYREAMDLGTTYLDEAEGRASPEDYIAVAQAFRRAGVHERAQVLLERARMAHPDHLELMVHLAHTYIDADELIAGAGLLQRAAERDPQYLSEAAALYRRAGAYERSLYMNARIDDQTAKFKQRVAILLDRKHFARIAAMESRLSRLGLLSEPDILYALAYAHFKVRNYDRSERLTRRIEDPEMFESAVQLRKAIETCREKPWTC